MKQLKNTNIILSVMIIISTGVSFYLQSLKANLPTTPEETEKILSLYKIGLNLKYVSLVLAVILLILMIVYFVLKKKSK